MTNSCILCNSPHISKLKVYQDRRFRQCLSCKLLYVAPSERPAPNEEKRRYQQHNNHLSMTGYKQFLFQAIKPALPYISKSERVLDYGCGPNPVLSQMLAEKGIACENYDPFFYPIRPVGKFDVIFSTEVWEHFHQPEETINELLGNLKHGGKVVVMTEMLSSTINPENWPYLRDHTHVCFYTPETFQYIADSRGLSIIFSDNRRVLILSKTG